MSENQTAAEQFRQMPPAQKFEVLLSSIQTLDMAIAELNAKQQAINEALTLMYKQLQSLMLVQNISNETIEAVIEQMETKELESKIVGLKDKGVIEDDRDGSVSESSFVVLRVLKDGKVHTNRAQAPVKMMSNDLKQALNGLKRGDAAEVNGLTYEVVEIYRVLEQGDQEQKAE